MKLLHTGDLHLDSAYRAYGARDAEKQRELGRDLLRRIFALARDEKCDLMLIAGDLFDSKFVSPETGELFCSLVKENNIPVVVSPGNHDPYVEGGFYAKASAQLGELLYVFSSPELQFFDIDGLRVRVFGYAFTSPALTQSPLAGAELPEDNGYIRLFCGHTEIGAPLSRYAPVSVEELAGFDFAYAALGHVHNGHTHTYLDGRAAYCGFGEGRSFDELGDGGVWLVETDGHAFNRERKILSERAFCIIDTEVRAGETSESLRNKIKAEVASLGLKGEIHARVLLQGVSDGSLGDVIRSADVLRRVCSLSTLELIDETLPLLDGEYLERDTTVRGELYRILLPKLTSRDPQERRTALRALRIGLAAIEGKNIFNTTE